MNLPDGNSHLRYITLHIALKPYIYTYVYISLQLLSECDDNHRFQIWNDGSNPIYSRPIIPSNEIKEC